MTNSDPSPSDANLLSPSSRREFLKNTAGLAAGAAAISRVPTARAAVSPSDPLLPTIRLGPHEVTRLILGGNPIYGFSHFNKLLDEHQKAWHTPERVVELLKHCEAKGLNTFQNSYRPRTLSDLEKYRADGGKMHWLCLGNPDWDQKPHLIEDTARRKPIGIAPHGSLGDRLYREKKFDVLTGLLKRIRDTGVLVGLSAHNPALVEQAEEKGWDVDYYMCCLYYRTRNRDEYVKLLGSDLPLGEIYLPSDP
ncbi:MAG: twin-arginine translocation signal domain-containing protein, partial [Verrucomicrobia bacterium]|nr:twin-arginine translocation signal domain-containing protein [Verrucomicrobiota bacterium]